MIYLPVEPPTGWHLIYTILPSIHSHTYDLGSRPTLNSRVWYDVGPLFAAPLTVTLVFNSIRVHLWTPALMVTGPTDKRCLKIENFWVWVGCSGCMGTEGGWRWRWETRGLMRLCWSGSDDELQHALLKLVEGELNWPWMNCRCVDLGEERCAPP